MKKIASCLLALALLVTLTACSGKSDNLSDGTDTSGTVSDTVKDTEKDTETAPAETTGESNTTGAETGTEQPTSDSKATAPAKDTTSATNPPATNPPSTNPPATNPPTTPPAVKTCDHSNTEVRNKKDATTSSEGYTGDTYCKDCGKLISSGSSIPKIKQTVSVSHDYYDAEMKAFNEINAERTKNGLSPLTWNEGLYAGAKIRAYEHYEFIDLGIGAGPHKRKNGDDFYTAVTETSDYSFGSFCVWGENCGGNSNSGDFVNGWMNSSAHKSNMLYNGYSQMAVAIIFAESTYHASCIFVG